MAMGRAWTCAWDRAWAVWSDTTKRQPCTGEWDRAVKRSTAVTVRGMAPQVDDENVTSA